MKYINLALVLVFVSLIFAGCLTNEEETPYKDEPIKIVEQKNPVEQENQSNKSAESENQMIEKHEKLKCKIHSLDKKKGEEHNSVLYLSRDSAVVEMDGEEIMKFRHNEDTTQKYVSASYFKLLTGQQSNCDWIAYDVHTELNFDDYVDYVEHPIELNNSEAEYLVSCEYSDFNDNIFEIKGKIC